MYSLDLRYIPKKRGGNELHKTLINLILSNAMARNSEDTIKVQKYHDHCASCVKRLMNGNYGVVTRIFRDLCFLGNGIPGDNICELTYKCTLLFLDEQLSEDIYTIIDGTERMERKIRDMVREKNERSSVRMDD